jgi:pimeloyl-ACP methyl ester carboxylesterase
MADPTTQRYLDAPVRTVDIGTARIPCRRFGDGSPVLLVHGFPLSGFTWRKVLPALAAHHTCWVPDLPGMGDSEWTDGTDFSFTGQARTLKTLADRLDLPRYTVLAQDTGGTFARHLALSDPRVEKLVLINTEIPGHRPPWIPFYQFLMGLPGAIAAFGLLLRSRTFLRSGMGFGGCFTDLTLLDGDFHAHVVEPLLHSAHRMEGLARYLRGLTWEPVDALAHDHARITVPVQLVWGADDPTFPVALARAMVRQLANGRLVEIPGARLLVHEEKPADVSRAALDFLG